MSSRREIAAAYGERISQLEGEKRVLYDRVVEAERTAAQWQEWWVEIRRQIFDAQRERDRWEAVAVEAQRTANELLEAATRPPVPAPQVDVVAVVKEVAAGIREVLMPPQVDPMPLPDGFTGVFEGADGIPVPDPAFMVPWADLGLDVTE